MRCPSNQTAGKGLWEEAAAQGYSKQTVCLALAAPKLTNQLEGAGTETGGLKKSKQRAWWRLASCSRGWMLAPGPDICAPVRGWKTSAPFHKMQAGRGAKTLTNITNTGPHWWKSWTLQQLVGFWEGTLKQNRH